MNLGKEHKFSLVLVVTAISMAFTIGCNSRPSTFSILPTEETFNQGTSYVNSKMDILWVIDNSGSMQSSQDNLAANFNRFISKFQEKNYDFQMAVTTSDAYKVYFGSPLSQSRFRDGTDWTSHTNAFIITPQTPDMINKFLINIGQGIYGSGDERAFQSIKAAFENQDNSGFLRSEAFLSVVIVSDEDDFSHNGSTNITGQYTNPDLHSVDQYRDYLDLTTNSTASKRNYNINAITIMDTACLSILNAQIPGRRVGTRYLDLASKTGGIAGSLCGDFGSTLSQISNRIIELSTRFPLARKPNPDTIEVKINGAPVPRDATNGYTYDEVSNSVVFHGTWMPAAGASISVTFDPATLL